MKNQYHVLPKKTLVSALVSLTFLFCVARSAAQPPTQPAATNLQPLRVVVLPFHNATGDTNWDDWQYALPSLTRTVGKAEFISAIGREKTKQALRRAGWTAGHEMNISLARQIALDSHASVAIWGKFHREKNQWLIEVELLNINTASGPVTLKITSPNWTGFAQRMATNLASYFGCSDKELNFDYSRKYLTDSEAALELLARDIRLEDQDAPALEQEKTLRRLLAKDPGCGIAYIRLIQIYDSADRTNESKETIHEFLQHRADVCDAHLQQAWLLGTEHDEVGMKREWLEALRVHPGCPQACREMFMYLGAVNQQWEEAATILESAHAVRPHDADITILLAAAEVFSGATESAASLLDGISDLPEEDETVDIALLVAALKTGYFELAGRELTRLGPQAAENETVRDTLNSAYLKFDHQDHEIAKPHRYSPDELNIELHRLLSVEEQKLVVNPVEITPEITAQARQLTAGLTNDTLRIVALFAEVSRRGRGDSDGGTRTAKQALAQANDPQTRFSCQEYAKLFVALARSLGLESWLVHIDRDAHGYPGYHDCAVVYLNGQGILVDPTWRVIGVQHKEFKVLDDLQAISHHAMQPQDKPDARQLRMGLKLNPADRWTQLQFVRGMTRLGDFDTAAAELAKVQKSGAENWDIHDTAGEWNRAQKRWKPALAEFQRALEFSPSNAIVHYHLAQTYDELHDHLKTTEHMEAALKFDRGEMTKEVRRDTAAAVASMKTILRGAAGDSSARSEMQRLAESGDVIAQIGMAKAFFDAQPPQTEEGMTWLLKAAEQGNAQPQFDYAKNLALLHRDAGKEVIQWLTRAAKQGHLEAQYRLGKFLYEGNLVPRDNVTAGQWILVAAGAGHKEAKNLWTEMELFLSPTEAAEARKQAAAFKPVSEQPTRKEN